MVTPTTLQKFPIKVRALFTSIEETNGDSIKTTIEKRTKIYDRYGNFDDGNEIFLNRGTIYVISMHSLSLVKNLN
jgi:hypothetical protein